MLPRDLPALSAYAQPSRRVLAQPLPHSGHSGQGDSAPFCRGIRPLAAHHLSVDQQLDDETDAAVEDHAAGRASERLVEERPAGRLQDSLREGRPRLSDRCRVESSREQGFHYPTSGGHPRPVPVQLLHRTGLHRPEESLLRHASALARRQPVDRHQTAENEYSGTRTTVGDTAAAYRKVQGFGQGQEPSALPRTVESKGELLPEGDCRPLRYRQGSDIPPG